jgi:5'-phosphate synthase pdxT subunit
MRIGVLALQGDFAAHIAAMAGAVEVRTAREIEPLDVLVLPGGESTTLLHLLAGSGIGRPRGLVDRADRLRHVRRRDPLAKRVTHPDQPSWGRSTSTSRETPSAGRSIRSRQPSSPTITGSSSARRASRAPATASGARRWNGEPVLVREGRVFAATFHPELTGDRRIHELVLAS